MSATAAIDFELVLPAFRLEGGASLEQHVVRGWSWGPASDAQALAAAGRVVDPLPWRVVRRVTSGPLSPRVELDARVPTIVVVHALTGDARAGDWWGPLIGPGQPLDPTRFRIVSFNLLGGCYGTTGPADAGFPNASHDRSASSSASPTDARMPATITTWDQARSILLALDALGIARVHLVTGGSLGGMVALALATLDPARFERTAPIAASPAASAWILAWNHVARQAILADPGFPDDGSRGLHLARQLAMTTYRAEPGFALTQGRGQRGDGAPGAPTAWEPRAPYKMQTYLTHQGDKLIARFDARAYVALIGAMDHHDLERAPPRETAATWRGVARITASTLAVGVDSDQLYAPEHGVKLVAQLAELGRVARYREVHSAHGHDAFLIEWDQLRPILVEAVAL